MIFNWLSWFPVVGTAILMYFARVSHIAVLHYNLFLALLLAWCAAVIAFYRVFNAPGERNGATGRKKL
ncbi:MAG: hypothetical protein JW836_05925 [Deltaproteobacteria bacterium]|nr:hypothetical protein [Deltaproteobacteria bacterium]